MNLEGYKRNKQINQNLLSENWISKGSFSPDTLTGTARAFASQVRPSHLSDKPLIKSIVWHCLLCACPPPIQLQLQGSDPKQKERGQDVILHLKQIIQETVLAFWRLGYGIANRTLNSWGGQHQWGLRAVFNGSGYNYQNKVRGVLTLIGKIPGPKWSTQCNWQYQLFKD